MYFCCGSLEKAISQVEPSPSVRLLTHPSLRNLPSGVKTWMRSFTRSHTYTRRSFDISAQWTGVGVDHGHAFVAVSVRNVGFVLFRVHEDLRDLSEVLGAVAVDRHAFLAEHVQELAVLRELQHEAVAAAIATDPDVALVVDRD